MSSTSTTQMDKTMTTAAFEALVDQTFKVIQDSKISTTREQLRTTLLERFAQMHGQPKEEGEALLRLNDTAAVTAEVEAPPATEEEAKARSEERVEGVRKMRATIDATAASTGATTPYFYEAPQDQAFMEMFAALRREAGLVANLLVTGPSGCGKTEGLKRAGERAGMPVYKVDCASITTPDRWVGHKEIDETGTHYVLSEHLRWIGAIDCEPGWVIYDEINRLHPTMLNILFPILDGSQSIWVPDLGIHHNVHPDTIFTATANIGVGFTGTHKMDDALSGRFGYRLERGFPPKTEEVTILQRRTGIDADKAKILVEIAEQTRVKARNSDLSMPVATRNLLDTAALVAAGMSISQAADYTFVRMFSEDGGAGAERVMVKQIVTGKAAAK